MPKLNSFAGADRFNFIISLISYLINRGDVPMAEVAEHFRLEPEYIRKVIRTIMESGFDSHSGFTGFTIDIDAVDDEGIVGLMDAPPIEGIPRISVRQAAALASGLSFLQSMDEFSGDKDIAALLGLLASGGASHAIAPIAVRPGTVDADLAVIRQAIVEQKGIRCDYINLKGEQGVRQIDPLRLVSRGNEWWVHAYCPINQSGREFKLDRMRKAEILDQPICKEALEIEVREELYIAQAGDTEVTLEVDIEAMSLVAELDAKDIVERPNSGTIQVTISVGHLPNLGQLISKYGGAARVIAPAEARNIVRDYALRALGSTSYSSSANDSTVED